MLEIKSKEKNYGINFPTSINEFTPEILANLVDGVKLSDHYAIVALCSEIKLFDFATQIRGNKGGTANMFPLLAKIQSPDIKNIKHQVGDRIVIDRSSLERGQHLTIPTKISVDNATKYLQNDETLMINIIKGTVKDATVTDPIIQNMIDNKHKTIFIVAFKIIAINDISASMNNDIKIIDPFKVNKVELIKN